MNGLIAGCAQMIQVSTEVYKLIANCVILSVGNVCDRFDKAKNFPFQNGSNGVYMDRNALICVSQASLIVHSILAFYHIACN